MYHDCTLGGPNMSPVYLSTREVSACIQQHPVRKVTQYEVAGLVKKTFHLPADMETAVYSFEKAKVFPYRPTLW